MTLVAVALLFTSGTVYADCSACGTALEATHDHSKEASHLVTFDKAAKKSCGADCLKPCCAGKNKTKKACVTGCMKPCCLGKTAVKKTCKLGCIKPCCAGADHAKLAETKGEICIDGLKGMLKSDKNLVLLDARGKGGYDAAHIPGAKALAADAADKAILAAAPDKKAPVITYCSSPACGASHKLGEKLKKLGYVKVYVYKGGIKEWKEAGNNVE
jgi:rhodanese-related sulfurtransferase